MIGAGEEGRDAKRSKLVDDDDDDEHDPLDTIGARPCSAVCSQVVAHMFALLQIPLNPWPL
jgi:ATPase family AAA domain-containing protein 2